MKKFILHCLAYFRYKKEKKNDDAITSLAPKILKDPKDLERINPYITLLKKTLDDREITNIALAGPFGAGKSTILRTFQHLNPSYKYLNISLASFKDCKPINPNGNGEGGDDLERRLEISVLQQIFYHVNASEIPDSRFKRIINHTRNKLIRIAICSVAWIFSAIIILKFNYFDKLDPNSWRWSYPLDKFALILFLIFFSGIGWVFKDLIRIFNNSKINKVNIKGELELGDKVDKSVFNEHLEEIIYFFERTDYDVVVIEDLDRFETTDIFTKLREINIILNKSKSISQQNRIISFVYAVRDEVFKEKSERVKFFEFIIPVIPFINPTNAGDQLTKLILEANLQNTISKDFLEDVMTFIDDIDMRLLINIFHEYLLYRQALDESLDQQRLFAMVTYKNLYPEDFGNLNRRKGHLYQILESRNTHVENYIKENNKQITILKRRLKAREKEELRSVHELRILYINALRNLEPNTKSVILENSEYEFSDLIEDENFELLQNAESITLKVFESGMYPREKRLKETFQTLESIVAKKGDYEARVSSISDKSLAREIAIKNEHKSLLKKNRDAESWTLQNVFEELGIVLDLKNFDNNPLISSLIVNGYLNENYSDYISLFHEVSITKGDNNFLRNVRSGVCSNFDLELTNLENLVKRIQLKYFRRDPILNIKVINYLGENYDNFKTHYDYVMQNLASGKRQGLDFIDAYIETESPSLPLFVSKLVNKWPEFWDHICIKEANLHSKMRSYLKLILQHADLPDILALNSSGNLTNYIEDQSDFIVFAEGIDQNKIVEILRGLDIQFHKMVVPQQEKNGLLGAIYDNSFYRINLENVSLFVGMYGNPQNNVDMINLSYSSVCSTGLETLRMYVDNNIEHFIEVILLPEGRIEEEASAVELINNPDIATKLIKLFIRKCCPIISDIEKIAIAENKMHLFEENKVLADWSNVFSFYEGQANRKLDDTLLRYLNSENNYVALSLNKIRDVIKREESDFRDLVKEITKCEKLDDNAYKSLLIGLNYTWKTLTINGLNVNKVRFLIDSKVLSFTEENYKMLWESEYSELKVEFIEKHFLVFVLGLKRFPIDDDDYLPLLKSGKITEKNKLTFLKSIDESLYSSNPELIKIAGDLFLLDKKHPISADLINSIFLGVRSTETRIKLLLPRIDSYTIPVVKSLISILGSEYADLFKSRHKPKFVESDLHRTLFSWLKDKRLIKDFAKDKKDKSLLRVTANYF